MSWPICSENRRADFAAKRPLTGTGMRVVSRFDNHGVRPGVVGYRVLEAEVRVVEEGAVGVLHVETALGDHELEQRWVDGRGNGARACQYGPARPARSPFRCGPAPHIQGAIRVIHDDVPARAVPVG